MPGDRPPRRHLDRGAVRADPRGQHRRRLERLRGGAPARRQAHRLRELEPRDRLLSPGRSDRARRPDAPRRPLRPQQGVRRERRALLFRSLRHRIGVPAHRLVVSGAEGSPHARDLAQLRRPRAPRRRQPHRAGRRLQRRLRHVRQHDDVVGQHLGARTSAFGRRTAPSPSAPRRRRASLRSTATIRRRSSRAARSSSRGRSSAEPRASSHRPSRSELHHLRQDQAERRERDQRSRAATISAQRTA